MAVAGRDVNVRLNIRGINELMRGDAAQKRVNEVAYRMRAAAGGGHSAVVPGAGLKRHRWVARAYVQQDDDAQSRKDPNGVELLRAMDSVKE